MLKMLPALTDLLRTISARLAPPDMPDTEDKPMPAGLSTWIDSWDDAWARDGQKAYANQLYAELGDWPKVEMTMKQEVEESVRHSD